MLAKPGAQSLTVPSSQPGSGGSDIGNPEFRESPDAHFLPDARRRLAHEMTNRARWVADPGLLEQGGLRLERVWRGRRDLLGHVADERAKVLRPRDEVRLTVHFHECAYLRVVMDVAADLALASKTLRTFRRLGRCLAAQVLDGLLHVPLGLLECLTTVEHAGSGQLSELLELLYRDVRHGSVPPVGS